MFLKWNYRETFCWFNILFRLIKHRYCLRQMRIWGSTFCLWYIRWTGLIGYYLKVHMPCVIIKFIDDILNLTNSIILVCSIPERILLQHQSDCVPFFSWQTWNQKKVSLEFFLLLMLPVVMWKQPSHCCSSQSHQKIPSMIDTHRDLLRRGSYIHIFS